MEPQLQVCDLSDTLDRLGGDIHLLQDLVRQFCEDAPALMVRLRRGLQTGDAEDFRLAAHSLKGLAANFGGARTEAVARNLERMAQPHQSPEACAVVESLQQEVDCLLRALVEESGGLELL